MRRRWPSTSASRRASCSRACMAAPRASSAWPTRRAPSAMAPATWRWCSRPTRSTSPPTTKPWTVSTAPSRNTCRRRGSAGPMACSRCTPVSIWSGMAPRPRISAASAWPCARTRCAIPTRSSRRRSRWTITCMPSPSRIPCACTTASCPAWAETPSCWRRSAWPPGSRGRRCASWRRKKFTTIRPTIPMRSRAAGRACRIASTGAPAWNPGRCSSPSCTTIIR